MTALRMTALHYGSAAYDGAGLLMTALPYDGAALWRAAAL
jgi:hypothetical protein